VNGRAQVPEKHPPAIDDRQVAAHRKCDAELRVGKVLGIADGLIEEKHHAVAVLGRSVRGRCVQEGGMVLDEGVAEGLFKRRAPVEIGRKEAAADEVLRFPVAVDELRRIRAPLRYVANEVLIGDIHRLPALGIVHEPR
jgi:hypothetical protein